MTQKTKYHSIFIHLLTYLFIKYLQCAILQGAQDTAVNNTEKNPCNKFTF